jgi:O-antigen/teichoic acid export membrane protein
LRRASTFGSGGRPALSITRNAFWLLTCRLGGDVLNLGLFVLISRVFGPAGLGLYSYGFAVTTFAYVVSCLGIEEYGLREYARMDVGQRPQFMKELLGTQLLMAVAAVIGLTIYVLLTSPSSSTLIVFVCLATYQIATAVSQTLFLPAMGQHRMIGPAVADLVCRALAIGSAIVTISGGSAQLPRALVGYPLAAAVLLVIGARSALRHGGSLGIAISRPALGRISRVLVSFAGVEVFVQLFSRVAVIALTLMRGATAAGLYATGLKVIELGLMPLNFIGIAAYPRLSQTFRHDRVAFQNTSRHLLWSMILIGGALAWGLYFAAPPLLVPVLGDRYGPARPVVRVMTVLAVMQCCELVLGRLLYAVDLQTRRALFITFGAAVAVALNVALVPRFGVDGAIYATAAAYAVINIMCGLALRRSIASSELGRVLATLSLILVAGAACVIVGKSQHLSLWMQAVAAAVASALAVAAGYILSERASANMRSAG